MGGLILKKIMPILILSLFLLCPANITYGAKKPECLMIENLFADNVKQVDKVCKVEVSRENFNISLEGVKVSPEMLELSFGANFERVGNTTLVAGEFALLPQEVNPVIDALRKGGIQITAIHNHWFEQPMVMYLHFQGKGETKSLAQTVKSAMDVTKQQ